MGVPEQVVDIQQTELDRQRFGEIAGASGANKVKTFRPYAISTGSMISLLRSADGRYIIIGAVPYGLGYFVFSGVKIDTETAAFEKVIAAIKGWSQYETRGRRP